MSPGLITGSNAAANIVAIVLDGICYGFSTCTFGITVWVLTKRDLRQNRGMLAIACILWVLSTVRMFVSLASRVDAYVNHASDGPEGPEKFLSEFWTPYAMVDNTFYAFSTLIGDAVVIYRCYVVWKSQSRLVIIFPCLAWLGALATVPYIAYSFHKRIVSGERILIFYVFTLVANLSATFALAYRIWSVDREAKSTLRSTYNLRPILLIVIESGAIYTTLLIAALITVLCALPGEFVINSIMSPMISITFDMIFLRIGFGNDSIHRKPAATQNASTIPLTDMEFQVNEHTLKNLDNTEHKKGPSSSLEYSPAFPRSPFREGSSTEEA